MSVAPICSGSTIVAEAADRERDDAEEDHDGAVHGAELVVELGRHRRRPACGPRRTSAR